MGLLIQYIAEKIIIDTLYSIFSFTVLPISVNSYMPNEYGGMDK